MADCHCVWRRSLEWFVSMDRCMLDQFWEEFDMQTLSSLRSIVRRGIVSGILA
jgi:hypothetical protein